MRPPLWSKKNWDGNTGNCIIAFMDVDISIIDSCSNSPDQMPEQDGWSRMPLSLLRINQCAFPDI